MTTLEDRIALCGLTASEVAAIAEHENISVIEAATLGQYLMHHQQGMAKIRQMVIEDMRKALLAGNTAHAAQLLTVLQHLLTHNESAERKDCRHD